LGRGCEGRSMRGERDEGGATLQAMRPARGPSALHLCPCEGQRIHPATESFAQPAARDSGGGRLRARTHTRTCCSATAMTVMPSGSASRQAGSSTCADTPAVMLPCHNTCYAAERAAWLGCCYLPFAECGDVVRFPEGHAGQARARHRLRIPPRQPRRTHRLERRARAPALAHRRALKQPQTRVKQRGGERGHVGRQGDPRQPRCVVQHAALPALALDLQRQGRQETRGAAAAAAAAAASGSSRRREPAWSVQGHRAAAHHCDLHALLLLQVEVGEHEGQLAHRHAVRHSDGQPTLGGG